MLQENSSNQDDNSSKRIQKNLISKRSESKGSRSSSYQINLFGATQIPQINIPQPKRMKKDDKKNYFQQHKDEQQIKPKIIKSGNQVNTDRNKNRKQQDKQKQKINKNNLKSRKINKDPVGKILSYFLGQSQNHQQDKFQELMSTVYQWQNRQIEKLVMDPNLGDFIIKLPNPDNLSQEYFKKYPDAKNQQKNVPIQYFKALQIFNDIFNVEGASKKRLLNERKSFLIAFYLLNFNEKINEVQNQFTKQLKKFHQKYPRKSELTLQKVEKQAKIFIEVFKYFLQIQQLQYVVYRMNKKKYQQKLENLSFALMENGVPSYQKQVSNKSLNKVPIILKLQRQNKKVNFDNIKFSIIDLLAECQLEINSVESFHQHKTQIFQYILCYYVFNIVSVAASPTVYGYDYEHINLNKARCFLILFYIFQKLPKISQFFTYFYQNGAQQLTRIFSHELTQKSPIDLTRYYRKIFKGQYLQKVIQKGNLIWVNTKSRPSDLFTLLRNCIIYQLTQNCFLRVRSFLTKNQKYIILIIKASQQVLQYYAQKNSIQMQIQLGATDIFSFQPVNQYYRPLRLHSYIRDESFRKKYSLESNKIDKDQSYQSKSIQSEALNIYKRAEKMNNDELRVKIILDQQQCDECFKWVSNKLNIKIIEDTNILTNQYNTKQVDRYTWQCYYVYNKLIIHFIKRIIQIFVSQKNNKQNQQLLQELNNNIGLILRLMFIKAIAICNNFFYDFRESKSIIPNSIINIFTSKRKLQNIWDRMRILQPSGFYSYVKNNSLQRMWRKFEVNQRKDRSKFFPAQRIHITNKIIQNYINIGQSIDKMHICNYFPLHDPFVLKNIKIEPYLINLKQKIPDKLQDDDNMIHHIIKNIYVQYQSNRTASDFTKYSVEKKLSVFNSLFQHFSVQTVRYYCGQKIAFYFDFIKHLTNQAFPFIIPVLIIQIILWVQQTHLLEKGSSRLKQFNDALVFILTLFNIFWTTNTVQRWKYEQKILAYKYGVSEMTQKQQKRVKFVGKFKRNFQTDDLNQEYVPKYRTIIKSVFTFIVNLAYFVFVCLVIIYIFVLKSIMFQKGYPQTVVNAIPSILISLVVQIFNYLYTYLIKLITQFQNHKTISSFEQSLISKSYIVTFVITFISIFIYAFFSQYLNSQFLCIVKTTITKQEIKTCDYFVSQQLLSLIMIDLLFALIGALLPYAKFLFKQFLQSRKQKAKTKLFFNKFQAIDQFYQEQDKMETYMFNDQIDNSWQGYMNVINVFTALSLFGPALPFMYVMLLISGIVRLHASKYQIIFLTKRSIPIKANSINSWLVIIEVISVISIFTNVAYMIFTRQVFKQNQSQLFFFFIIVFFLLKYYLILQYEKRQNQMGKRNKLKVTTLLLKKSDEKNKNIQQNVNTDILNVYYKQVDMKRILPKMKKAKVAYTNR